MHLLDHADPALALQAVESCPHGHSLRDDAPRLNRILPAHPLPTGSPRCADADVSPQAEMQLRGADDCRGAFRVCSAAFREKPAVVRTWSGAIRRRPRALRARSTAFQPRGRMTGGGRHSPGRRDPLRTGRLTRRGSLGCARDDTVGARKRNGEISSFRHAR